MLITQEHLVQMVKNYNANSVTLEAGFIDGLNAMMDLVDKKLREEKNVVISEYQKKANVNFKGLNLTVVYDEYGNNSDLGVDFTSAYVDGVDVSKLLNEEDINDIEFMIEENLIQYKKEIEEDRANDMFQEMGNMFR